MEQQPSSSSASQSPTKDEDVLQDWSKDELYTLYMALKTFGSHDIDMIYESILTKTPEQIQAAIDYYKKKALRHPIVYERKRKEKVSVKSFPRIPLASWAKNLTDSLSYEDLQTETADALRLIAEFENIPTAVCTDNIDFRKLYHFVANAMEGKELPDDDMTVMILNKCIVDTALISKAFIKNSSLKYIVESVDITDKEIVNVAKPTSNCEFAAISHLASQKNYNPLNIKVGHLKPSK